MKAFCEKTEGCSEYSWKSSSGIPNRLATSATTEAGQNSHNLKKPSVWLDFFVSAFSVFDNYSDSRGKNKVSCPKTHGWTVNLRRVINSGSMRRFLGLSKTGGCSSNSDIWLLGNCYTVADGSSLSDPTQSEGFASFVEDFSSRILITYRKGFAPIGDSKYTSDVNWGCMLRSSQMLVAQALIVHHFGRSWRKTLDKPMDRKYLEILHMFGDSESSPYSIHNLLDAGKIYHLAPGSWVGPYAMCRTWETIAHGKRKDIVNEDLSSMIAIYVVSGDDGERGGAPVVCIEDITRYILEHSMGPGDWMPIILLVPLVLGLEKINPRYIPLLGDTFQFPQSLGIMGGTPRASTYIVGLQDENAFYLDPHEVQPVAEIMTNNLEGDATSYHSNILRQFPLSSIDPSLAIGFYCRDKRDFDDFCSRASKLVDKSNGAPLFTVTEKRKSLYAVNHHDNINNNVGFAELEGESEHFNNEDEWEFL